MAEKRIYEVQYVEGLIAEVERLSADLKGAQELAYRRLSELRDAEDEIERLTAERNALIPVAAQAVPLGWKEIEQQNTRLRAEIKASGGLKCPSCDDVGYTVDVYASEHGDGFEFVQVQCEFCYTVADSIFNRKAALEVEKCTVHDFVSRGDGTARCSDCGEQVDVSETGAAR